MNIIEVAKCAKDVEYFIDNYVWIDGDSGIVPLNMGRKEDEDYFYQREILHHYMNGDNILILKNRRAGFSWIVGAISAWLINFHKGYNILYASRSEKEAITLLQKPRFILYNLAAKDSDNHTSATKADWLLNSITIDNQKTFGVGWMSEAGDVIATSVINSLTTTKHSGRGEKASFVVVDEIQFIEHQEELVSSLLTTASLAGSWIVGSSAGDVGTWFHKQVMKARRGENTQFWYRHVLPHESGISDKVLEASKDTLPDELFRQEWYGDFRQPGNAVFNSTHLAACYKPLHMHKEIRDYLAAYQHRVEQDKDVMYYSGVDSALGKTHRKSKEKDYNAFIALTQDGVQAFTELNKEPLSYWAGADREDESGNFIRAYGMACHLHHLYPGVAVIEENDSGRAVIARYIVPNDGISKMYPFDTKHNTKSRIINNLRIAIESHSIVITDEETYQQLSMYQHGNIPGTFTAPNNFWDDAVMALALAWEAIRREGSYIIDLKKQIEEIVPQPDFDRYNETISPGPLSAPPMGVRGHTLLDDNAPNSIFLPSMSLTEYFREKKAHASDPRKSSKLYKRYGRRKGNF